MGRCGFGPRLPLLVVSSWARANFVDRSLTNQASIIRFIEGNWGLGHIDGSFDAISRNLTHMFNFGHRQGMNTILLLNPDTGQPEN
jgi:phospholipase C